MRTANRFHFDLLHQYLLRLNGGLFFTANFRHCKWFVAMNGWLILISAINAAAKNIPTHTCTRTRTHARTQMRERMSAVSRPARQRLCAKDVHA